MDWSRLFFLALAVLLVMGGFQVHVWETELLGAAHSSRGLGVPLAMGPILAGIMSFIWAFRPLDERAVL